jgi:plastocyanin
VRLAVVVVAGAVLLGAAPAQAAKKKTIRLGDNYFLPAAPKVARGTTVVWRWPGAEAAGDVHDVKLRSGPQRAKRFHSEPASADFSFRRKLRVPGRYRIVCTLHEEMRMTIRVRR